MKTKQPKSEPAAPATAADYAELIRKKLDAGFAVVLNANVGTRSSPDSARQTHAHVEEIVAGVNHALGSAGLTESQRHVVEKKISALREAARIAGLRATQ
jgi:hypothetical protein